MGFWGAFVVHQGDRSLRQLLPDIAELEDAEGCLDRVAPGWQVTRIFASLDDLPAGVLDRVRDATGAPVLSANVLDSDAAFVTAVGMRTPGWRAWLQLDRALGNLMLPPSPFDADGNYLGADWVDPDYEEQVAALRERILLDTPGGSAAAPAARDWAIEAGFRPSDVAAITGALEGSTTFVEDLFFDLLHQLGVAGDGGRPVPAR